MPHQTKINQRFQISWLLCSITLCVFVSACSTPTPTPTKPFTIGVVNNGKNLEPVLDGFKAGMVDLGYTGDNTINYQYDGPDNNPDKLAAIAQKLVDAKVDMILALGTLSAKAAHRITDGTNIPVVFVPVGGPVQAGIVASIKSPGGNITGIATGLDYHAQRLEWLTKLNPNTKRVFIPYNPTDDSPVSTLPIVKDAATKLGLELVLRETRNNDEITAVLKDIPSDIDSIFMLPDSMINSRLADFVKVANERKLPLSVHFTSMAADGALFSYGYDQSTAGKQAARLADQIYKGTKPASLPVETTEYFLSINLKTAQALGLTISDDVLRQAKTVIR